MIYAESILLCVAIPLLIILIFVKGNVRQFIGAVLVGMIIGLLSSYVIRLVNLINDLGETATMVYLAPITEELLKILPLLLFLVLFEPESKLFMLTSIAIGAGFAIFDNCFYLLGSGDGNLILVIIRSLSVGVMHIVSILALSLWLVILRRRKMLTVPTVLGAVALPTAFHALYNLLASRQGASSIIGYILPIVTAVFLIFLYRRVSKNAQDAEIAELQEEPATAPGTTAEETAEEKGSEGGKSCEEDRDGEEVR